MPYGIQAKRNKHHVFNAESQKDVHQIMVFQNMNELDWAIERRISSDSCMDGWLHINKGVQACRPASKHVFVREHMQAHTACCKSGYIRLFYHDRS